MARFPDREMKSSWGKFDTTIKLCLNAHNKGSTARYLGLLNTLETSFFKFDEDWRHFKEDTIKKTCKTDEALSLIHI